MADDENEEIVEEEGSGGTNKLLLAGILIAGLAIGGGGAFFFLGQSPDETQVEEDVVEEPEEEVELFEAKFVVFEGMAVPIHNNRGKYIGNYKISIKVLTENDNDNVKVKNLKFQLRHAFISRIAKGGMLQENSTNLDYDKTSSILKEIAKNIVGEDAIYGVTVEDAMRVNN